MTAASELQVTRVTSSARSPFESVQRNRKKRVGGPVATLPRVTMAIDGRIALMTSRDAFDGVTAGRGRKIVRLVSGSARSRTITEGKSGTFRTHSKTKNRGAKRGKRA